MLSDVKLSGVYCIRHLLAIYDLSGYKACNHKTSLLDIDNYRRKTKFIKHFLLLIRKKMSMTIIEVNSYVLYFYYSNTLFCVNPMQVSCSLKSFFINVGLPCLLSFYFIFGSFVSVPRSIVPSVWFGRNNLENKLQQWEGERGWRNDDKIFVQWEKLF